MALISQKVPAKTVHTKKTKALEPGFRMRLRLLDSVAANARGEFQVQKTSNGLQAEDFSFLLT